MVSEPNGVTAVEAAENMGKREGKGRGRERKGEGGGAEYVPVPARLGSLDECSLRWSSAPSEGVEAECSG